MVLAVSSVPHMKAYNDGKDEEEEVASLSWGVAVSDGWIPMPTRSRLSRRLVVVVVVVA